MKILALDQLNKTVQFDITENCSGVSFKFDKTADLNYKVELISKNDTNRTLLEGSVSDLSKILNQFLGFNGSFVPFANRKNLILTNDVKIRFTIDWKTAPQDKTVTSIAYDLITEFEETTKPLVILKESFSISEEVSTENYDYLLLPEDFESFESVSTVTTNGVVKQTKQFMTAEAFSSLTSFINSDLLLRTFSGQKVKINVPENVGEVSYYLIQF